MGIVTGTLAQLGYEWAYRVLDAQYFGVPQRRRRVYIVGHYGRRGSAVRVLFDDVQATVDTEAVTRAKHPPSERAEGLPRAFVIQYNDGGSHKRADRPKGGMYVYETPHALTVGTPDTLVLVTPEGPRYCTTIEVERLMGFPDGWTEGHSKTRRFLMLRNAVVVPVIEWLGQRIVKEHNETVP
jgi:DNA (cytosine-5)-methyltransferase 1